LGEGGWNLLVNIAADTMTFPVVGAPRGAEPPIMNILTQLEFGEEPDGILPHKERSKTMHFEAAVEATEGERVFDVADHLNTEINPAAQLLDHLERIGTLIVRGHVGDTRRATRQAVGAIGALVAILDFARQETPADVSGPPQYAEGEFSVVDWSSYPQDVPRPTRTRLLPQGVEYELGRELANRENASLQGGIRRRRLFATAHEIHEIQPVKFGGNPVYVGNKIALPPAVHAQLTSFWRRILESSRTR
jgi:hypothetical protein